MPAVLEESVKIVLVFLVLAGRQRFVDIVLMRSRILKSVQPSARAFHLLLIIHCVHPSGFCLPHLHQLISKQDHHIVAQRLAGIRSQYQVFVGGSRIRCIPNRQIGKFCPARSATYSDAGGEVFRTVSQRQEGVDGRTRVARIKARRSWEAKSNRNG